MRILCVNHYVGPERYCPAFRPTHLARQWVKAGHEVTIVVASFSHLFHAEPVVAGPRATVEEGGVRYVLLKTPRYQGNGVRRALNMFVFVARLARLGGWIRRDVRPDVIVAGSVHGLDVWTCRRWARACGARLVRDVRDLWPLTLTTVGGLPKWNPMVWLLDAAERYSYAAADLVVTTLPGSLEHMASRGLPRDRWRYIPQGADVERWDEYDAPLPEPHRDVLARFKAQGRTIVGYVGSHGPTNALDTLLEAAARLRQRPLAFVLVGQGPVKPAVQDSVRRLGLTNVVLLPPVRREAVKAFLAEVDVAFLGRRASLLYEAGTSPNKLMDYMLAAKPVIHSGGSDRDLDAESGCGVSAPGDDPAALAAAIERLLDAGPAERARLGQRGRAHVVQHYPYSLIAARYLRASTTPGVDLTNP